MLCLPSTGAGPAQSRACRWFVDGFQAEIKNGLGSREPVSYVSLAHYLLFKQCQDLYNVWYLYATVRKTGHQWKQIHSSTNQMDAEWRLPGDPQSPNMG
jgi:hypothetical protein